MGIETKIIITFFSGLFLLSYSCTLMKKYPQDNVVEEIVEEVIEAKTGLDIDLSPGSLEK